MQAATKVTVFVSLPSIYRVHQLEEVFILSKLQRKERERVAEQEENQLRLCYPVKGGERERGGLTKLRKCKQWSDPTGR